MGPIIERCCGLDVHQAVIVACILVGKAGRKVRREVRRFAATTAGLLALADWLREERIEAVAMESTGVYWRPVYNLLEGEFTLIVGNAQHMKNVPGRKTDVKDCEWIAELLRHGLIRASFVPPRPVRALRDLTRSRAAAIYGRTAERNRLLKVLECANIKIASVASDVFGVSGMRMLRALAEGKLPPAQIAELAVGRLRQKLAELTLALEGSLEAHHRFLIDLHLRMLAAIDAAIEEMGGKIDEHLEPFRAEHRLLTTIPGVDAANAAAIIGEIGVDMSAWGTPERFAAWAGICPGNNESAGKRRRSAARKGNRTLKTVLHGAGVSAARKKDSYFRDKHRRIRASRGPARAASVMAHKLGKVVFHVLAKREPYRELGAGYLDRVEPARVAKNLTERLKRRGFRVTLERVSA
jgi:transposase